MLNFGKSERPVEVLTCALSPFHFFLMYSPSEVDFGSDTEMIETASQMILIHNFEHARSAAKYLYSHEPLADNERWRLRTAVEQSFGVKIDRV